MGDTNPTPSCLSAEKHDPRDPTMHYLGCTEFSQRQRYLAELETSSTNKPAADRIKSELRRIKYLRGILKNSKDVLTSCLVANLKGSMEAWRGSGPYQSGIIEVQAWSKRNEKYLNEVTKEPDSEGPSGPYHPDDDIKGHLIIYKDGVALDNLQEYGLNDKSLDHKFPISRLTRSSESAGSKSVLSRLSEVSDGRINYLHLPANNMTWIEEVIRRYFGEEDQDDQHHTNHTPSNSERGRTQILLRPQLWTGQQHGGKSAEIHARHMRPLCELVPSDPLHVDAMPRDMVLYMPYLHWETDRQRGSISHFLGQEEAKHRRRKERDEHQRKKERQFARKALKKPEGSTVAGKKHVETMGHKASEIYKTLSQVVGHVPHAPRSLRSPLFKCDKHGRVLPGKDNIKGRVGQVLIDAARLYEAITGYRDKMLIREYLYKNPPLHPRRTLDQAYYSTLKTTRARDRDQVVYRGTRPDPPHSINVRTGKWTCFDEEMGGRDQRPRDTSEEERNDEICVHCANHVRKVSRIIMVDQLWLWILDEKTIITAFPKRYGLNKQDTSGAHKSIRRRLQNLRPRHIKTVFDLAVIILDELTNVFFDRTKTANEQPEVLNIFSETIGNINNRQTLSYHHLWDWTKSLAKAASPGALPTDMSKFVAPLLNISTEGELQQEIKDVIDELNIMLYLQSQQLEVIRSFRSHARKLLDPKDQLGSGPASPTLSNMSPSSPNMASIGRRNVETNPDSSKMKKLDWLTKTSQDLVNLVETRITELRALKESAESTSSSLDNLLGLKQQQASVVQAWQSVQQAEEAVKQGRTIMIFTVITIIFLPLAFIASIFGMNNKQISGADAPMTLQQQFKLMFPVSLGLIVVVIVFAYSNFVRTLAWLAYRYLITLMLVQTRLYDWVYLSLDWGSASLTRRTEEKLRDMKLLVKKKKRKRMWHGLERRREEEQKKADLEDKKSRQQDPEKEEMNGEANGTSSHGQPPNATATTLMYQGSVFALSTSELNRPHLEPPNGDLEAGPGTASSNPRRLAFLPAPRRRSEGVQTTPSLNAGERWLDITAFPGNTSVREDE